MILLNYIIKEILYIFIKIFAILLLILFFLQFNRLLYGYIDFVPINVIIKIIFLSIPEFISKIFSLVFSLSICIFFFRINKNN